MRLCLRQREFSVPTWLLPLLGYLISIASLVWVLQGVELDEVLQNVSELHWRWVAIGVVADIAVYFYQAWRWDLVLRPVKRVSPWRSVQAIYVGLFSNEVLPLRPGELIRSYLQARWSDIPFSVSLSSAIIERIFDGIWLVVVFAFIAIYMAHSPVHMPRGLVDGAKVLSLVVLALALLLAVVMFWKHHAHAAVPKTRWGQHLRVLIEDLHMMGRSRSFYYAALASLPYLLIQVIPIFALIRGYDLDIGLGPAMVVLVILRLGTTIPQAPGNVGTSQALMVLALGLFGVDKTTATGLAMVTWGVITLPLLIGGFIALALTGSNLGELRDHAKAHAARQRRPIGTDPLKAGSR
jgi:glycosyltransferase 2 family protein